MSANTGAALRAILLGADLNLRWLFIGSFPRLKFLGKSRVRWQNVVRANHGICAVDELLPHCVALCGRCPLQVLVLYRALSHPGLPPTDLARVFARYRGYPGCECCQALGDGTLPGCAPLPAGRCQRAARLAVLDILPTEALFLRDGQGGYVDFAR